MECVETVVKKRVNIQKCFAAQICSVCVCVECIPLSVSAAFIYSFIFKRNVGVFTIVVKICCDSPHTITI